MIDNDFGIIGLNKIERYGYFYVYALLDPRDGGVRYVGRTYNLKGRLKAHVATAKKVNHTQKGRWICELLELELEPELRVLCFCGTHEENVFMEQFFIKWFTRLMGDSLTNGYELKSDTPGIDEFIRPGVELSSAYELALDWFYNRQKDAIDSLVKTIKRYTLKNS